MRLREQVAGLTLSKVPVGIPIFVAVLGSLFSKLDHHLAGSFLAAAMLVLAVWCKNSLRPEDQLGFKIGLLCCATSAVVFGLQATNSTFGLVPVYFTFISYFFWHKSGGLLLGWVNLVLICSIPKN